jgi:hypothetical protein
MDESSGVRFFDGACVSRFGDSDQGCGSGPIKDAVTGIWASGTRRNRGGDGPCRHCLRDFKVGQEKRILFTYDPFYELKLHPLPGPIFIHAEACPRFTDEGKFPEDLRSHRLALAGYGAHRSLLCEKIVENGSVDSVIDGLFARPDVQFIHVRDTEAGCYDLRIDRGQ